MTTQIKEGCQGLIDWICVALVCITAGCLIPLFTPDPNSPLTYKLILFHCNSILIFDISALIPSVNRAARTLISSNISDLMVDQCTVHADQEKLRRKKDEKVVDTLLEAAYKLLLNFLWITDATIVEVHLWTSLVHTSKYWRLS